MQFSTFIVPLKAEEKNWVVPDMFPAALQDPDTGLSVVDMDQALLEVLTATHQQMYQYINKLISL